MFYGNDSFGSIKLEKGKSLESDSYVLRQRRWPLKFIQILQTDYRDKSKWHPHNQQLRKYLHSKVIVPISCEYPQQRYYFHTVSGQFWLIFADIAEMPSGDGLHQVE